MTTTLPPTVETYRDDLENLWQCLDELSAEPKPDQEIAPARAELPKAA